MTMKIQNNEGIANAFNWTYNPQTYDDAIDNNYTIQPIPYQKHHFFTSGGGINPKSIVMTGHLSGSAKFTEYRSLSLHFQESSKLKRLYWESDKFHIGIGKQIKQTNSGGRTNFLDYVATFTPIIGILFGDTLRTSGTNAGNIGTFVEKITGTVTNGSNPIIITDNHGITITIPASVLTTGNNFLLDMVRMVDTGSGIKYTKYNYVAISVDSGTTDGSTTAFKLIQSGQNFSSTVNVGDLVHNTTDNTYASVIAVDGNTQLSLSEDIMATGETFIIYNPISKVQVDPAYGLLKIEAGENVSTISTTNITSVSKKFRDGFTS